MPCTGSLTTGGRAVHQELVESPSRLWAGRTLKDQKRSPARTGGSLMAVTTSRESASLAPRKASTLRQAGLLPPGRTVSTCMHASQRAPLPHPAAVHR